MDAKHAEGLAPRKLEEITRSANIPTLLMVIYQVTGDRRWLEPPYRPTRTRGLGDHDSGGLTEAVQAEIRRAAADCFSRLQRGESPAIASPTPEQMTAMMSSCVGEPVEDSYGIMLCDEICPTDQWTSEVELASGPRP